MLTIKTSVNWLLSESTGPDRPLRQDREGMLLFLTGENKQLLVLLANQLRGGKRCELNRCVSGARRPVDFLQ